MADAVTEPNSDSAERAYAAAAEGAVTKADVVVPAAKAAVAPLEFPAKPKRASAPQTAQPANSVAAAVPEVKLVQPELVAAAPEAVAPTPEPVTVKAPVVAKKAPVRVNSAAVAAKKIPAAPKTAPVAAKKVSAAKKLGIIKKPEIAKKPATLTKTAAAEKHAAPAKLPALAKLAKVKKPSVKTSPILALKEMIMPTKKTTDFTTTVKTAAADVQAKAKLALAKGSVVMGEASDFTKGNVEAVVASGKILAAGMKELGTGYAADGKSAYETMTADVKELSAVKSATDFVQVQTAIVRRNLDHAFELGAKNTEAMMKLASASFAPLSARVSLAVGKFKQAA